MLLSPAFGGLVWVGFCVSFNTESNCTSRVSGWGSQAGPGPRLRRLSARVLWCPQTLLPCFSLSLVVCDCFFPGTFASLCCMWRECRSEDRVLMLTGRITVPPGNRTVCFYDSSLHFSFSKNNAPGLSTVSGKARRVLWGCVAVTDSAG